MTHKTDVKQTSDLAGFAAREAGEPLRVKHMPGDLRDAIMEQVRAMGEAPSILGVCADDPEHETWVRKHAKKGDTVRLAIVNSFGTVNRSGYRRLVESVEDGNVSTNGHYFRPEEYEVLVDPEEEAARAARPRTTHEQIESTCNAIRDMLLEKNRKYGDSALDPVRIFSRATPVEQILVRLDDKLSRLRSAQADEDEDVVDDLIGYLVLLKIARLR